MGRVWLARDELLNRDVAIKEVPLPAGLTDEERSQLQARSLREARAIARLDHANVVRVFDVVSTDSGPWIVMEYIPSQSLQYVLTHDGPLPPARVAQIGLGILAALRAAHDVGILHRDVKPANVLLGVDGRVVLTDFGLAMIDGDPLLTRTGMVLGTPAYLAPERAFDEPSSIAADLWSLGATLYAAVEGDAPYARLSPISTLAALTTEPLPRARHAGRLRPVLHGLLAKDPDKRIDANQAERLLVRAAAGRRGTRTAPGTPAKSRTRHRRRTPVAFAIGVIALLLVALYAAQSWGSRPHTAAAQRHRSGPATVSTRPSQTPDSTVVPDGWHRYTDPTGFSVAVPDGWTVTRKGSIVYFTDPDHGRLLGIDQNDHPNSDALADWTAQETRRVNAGDFPDYQRIRIAPVDYFVDAADWEFTFTDGDTPVHVINRGFVTAPGKGYAIYWSTPAEDWTDNVLNFTLITDSFTPAQPTGK